MSGEGPKVYNPKPSDQFFGKGSRSAEGLFGDVRQRVAPGLFRDVDREWRAKWLKAQELTPREKAFHFFYLWDNPDFRKARLNPIRRMWTAPGDALERALRPICGLKHAFVSRFMLGKACWGILSVWAITYYTYYNSGDWTRKGGWKAHYSKPATMPENPHYPKKDPKWERGEAWMYNDQGFSKNTERLSTSTPLQFISSEK